jgi:hypothetical protein
MRQKNRTNWIKTGRRKIKRMEQNMRKYEDKRMREKRKETIGNSTKSIAKVGRKQINALQASLVHVSAVHMFHILAHSPVRFSSVLFTLCIRYLLFSVPKI